MANLWSLTEPNESQGNKVQTIVDYMNNVIKGVSDTITVTFPSDANYTPDPAVTVLAKVLLVAGALSASTKNLVLGNIKHEWVVYNNTTGGQSIQVIGSSGTGVTIANGAMKRVIFDGTNYRDIS